MRCKKGHEVRVLRSEAGFYWGTLDPEDGTPYCRISSEYASAINDATKLRLDRQITDIGNYHCNGGDGCFNVGCR